MQFLTKQALAMTLMAAALAPVDLGNQFRDRPSFRPRYFVQVTPEGIFEADARPVATNDD